ncbi:MAG: hypothetical protein HQL06_17480 [Nitrospirae bacterium]|nr:hypothetical protein [Nitrospirota bacterium]
MKRSLVYLMLLVVALFGVSVWSGNTSTVTAADMVTYTLPYLHTASGNVIYCVISNNTSDNATVAVKITANAAGSLSSSPTADLITTTTAANKQVNAYQTRMLIFNGTDISLDSNTIGSVSGSTATSSSYGALIILTSANTVTAAGGAATLACDNAPMACFQGTTSPKRNLVGYTCKDNNAGAKGTGTTMWAY